MKDIDPEGKERIQEELRLVLLLKQQKAHHEAIAKRFPELLAILHRGVDQDIVNLFEAIPCGARQAIHSIVNIAILSAIFMLEKTNEDAKQHSE